MTLCCNRGLQIGVVGADAGGDDHLQLLGLREALRRHVGGPERLGDHDFGIGQLPVENAVGTVFAGGDDILMAMGLEILAQAQFAGNAAQQGAWSEIDAFRRGEGLAVRISLDPGQSIARIRFWRAGDQVVIQNTQYFRHRTRSVALEVRERAQCTAMKQIKDFVQVIKSSNHQDPGTANTLAMIGAQRTVIAGHGRERCFPSEFDNGRWAVFAIRKSVNRHCPGVEIDQPHLRHARSLIYRDLDVFVVSCGTG